MRVFINRVPVHGPWGGGNGFVRALYEHLPKLGIDVVCATNMGNILPDVFLIIGLDPDGRDPAAEQVVSYAVHVHRPIVLRVNECDARKNTSHVDARILNLSQYVDRTIFVSEWMRDYYVQKGWMCPDNIVIKNGVDVQAFRPQVKLDDGATHIVSAHWSDNPMKGQDITEWLDFFVGVNPGYQFTYVGRTKAILRHGRHVQPLFGKALGDEMSRHDVCINGTRFDPGPNSVIEPIACGLPTYVHRDGGGAVEFAGDDHVFEDLTHLERILRNGTFVQNRTQFGPWQECMRQVAQWLTK